MDTFAKANLQFLRDNAGIEMPPRPEGVPEILDIDINLVQNGDTFNIMRLDGLDPMIAWAMGAATGHTAIALWENGEVLNKLICRNYHFLDFSFNNFSLKWQEKPRI